MTKPTSKRTAPKKTTPKRKPGRPSLYTPELVSEICERLSKGEPLAVICRDAHMPNDDTVRDWMERSSDVKRDIARAREAGFDAIALEALQIADDSKQDFRMTDRGPAYDAEHVQRSKLRVETRLKLLAKWDPKRYGEKIALGAAEDLPPLHGLSDEQLRAKIAEKMELLGLANAAKPD